LLSAWTRIEQLWEVTVNPVVFLGQAKLDQQVNCEWSFVETRLRGVDVRGYGAF
jgi:hypothetical protein